MNNFYKIYSNFLKIFLLTTSFYSCNNLYSCSATIGTTNVTGATLNGGVYEIANGATITLNTTGSVMPSSNYTLSYAFFTCLPTLPFTPSQLADLSTVPCYLGSDNNNPATDVNNGGVSSTANYSTLYVVPYTRYMLTAGSIAKVDDGNGCYAIGSIITLKYLSPPCSASIGTLSITDATLNGGAYEIADGAMVKLKTTGSVMPSSSYTLSYAFFSCAPSLPLTPSQLLDLSTVPCYLGSDNGNTTSDENNSGFSSTFSTLNEVYVLPYTRSLSLGLEVVVNDGSGCFAIGNLIKLKYLPSSCTASVGNLTITGATLNGAVYEIPVGSTVNFSTTGSVMPTGSHQLSYAFFSCAPSFPLTSSQLLDLSTISCYLGSDNGTTTSDLNNAGFSNTFTTLNRVYVLPYTRAISLGTAVIVNDGSGCYDIGSLIELYYTPPFKICPSDLTFAKVDMQNTSNFITPFTPTSFRCGVQTIWKNLESSIGTNGEIQTSPGFNLNIHGLSSTKSSILVSINNVPYSYYGPVGTAPANVIDWGPLVSNFDMIEPYIKSGATVTLKVCDNRIASQNMPYTVYDHTTGLVITSGSLVVSSGNCKTITFNVSTPTITWNIDGNPALITNNNDGSASFDVSALSVGTHVINYSFSNGPSCNYTATQNITVDPLIVPTFTTTSNLCQNSTPPNLPTSSTNTPTAITGTWLPATISTLTLGSQTYLFTPTAGQCATNKQITVTIDPNVTPTFSTFSDLCVNSTPTVLPSTSLNNIAGSWNPSLNTNIVGTASYTFTPVAGACASPISINVNVVEKPIAKANPNVIVGNPVLEVDFTNLSSNYTTLQWNFGNGETSNSNASSIGTSYPSIGDYVVTLRASNGICADSVWTTLIKVLPYDPVVMNIPNVFSPNNDGLNDNYFIDLKNAAAFEGTIFNRWGNEMVSLNQINQKWDGKSTSGEISDEGVYFIKYKITGLDKTIKEGVAYFHLQL